MNHSLVEQEFIDWCHELHPDVNPYIFIQRHTRYSEEYLPLIEDFSVKLHNFILNKRPNINWSFKGRIKSKRSFFIKTYRKIAENIEAIFDAKTDISEREKNFEKFFKFLKTDNPKKYEELKNITLAISPTLDYHDCFTIIFNKLSKEEKDKFITRLGRTEDTYAYRTVVSSVDFPIKSIYVSPNDSKIYVIDENGTQIPINTAIQLNPNKDIIKSEQNQIQYVNINGKQEILNENDLLYSSFSSSKNRNIKNAEKDENGNITLLGDSIVLSDNSHLDIIDIKVNSKNGNIFLTDSNGEIRNLSELLRKGHIKLRKYDETTLVKALYDIDNDIQDFYSQNDIIPIKNRRKDYIQKPKPDTLYMALHDSSFITRYRITVEGQLKVYRMDSMGKNGYEEDENENSITSSQDHDAYKHKGAQQLYNNKILAKILAKNPNAFDSSTPVLMDILQNPDIAIAELLGKYLLITSFDNKNSISYQPDISIIFNHTFRKAKETSVKSIDNVPNLDFSNYSNFMISRKKLMEYLKRDEQKFPDIYDDY